MIESLNLVSIVTALGGGLVSFFAPCVIPLLPAYVSYVSGVSLQDLQKGGASKYRRQIFSNSILYMIGFSVIFVILGAFAGSLGSLLRTYDRQVQLLGGIFMLVFGLQFAGIIHIRQLDFKAGFAVPSWTQKFGALRAFFIGNVFALAWTPCVSAILASILTLATVGGDILGGAILLFIYSLGISVPFLIVSLALSSAPPYLRLVQKHTETFSYISGLILTVIGLLLITGTFTLLNNYTGILFQRLGIETL